MPPVPRALTALGPAYIKFGQILSTRPDVVGDRLARSCRCCRTSCRRFRRPSPGASSNTRWSGRSTPLFSEFSDPVAAASIAQVHKARLAGTDRDVAVKVLRPGVERAFRKDIDAFYLIAWVIETLSPASRRLRPRDVIAHFEGVVMQELDLRIESSAAGEFGSNTEGDAGFVVPPVEWFLSSRRMMTLGWAEGIPLSDLERDRRGGA
jgi:ubiquinone biosynthesis protein